MECLGGVYRIPCSCGDVYIGTTKRSANARIKEHERNCRLRQAENSALAEHSLLYPEHKILFEETTMLRNKKHYHPRLYLEAIEIFKHKNCLNRKEEGLKINKTWYPAIENCKTKQCVTLKT